VANDDVLTWNDVEQEFARLDKEQASASAQSAVLGEQPLP
jgi:hypothetical protein